MHDWIPWRHGAYFSTGRDALCALLATVCGRPARRLWIPGYYCPDVVRTLLSLAPTLSLELRTYPAPPPSPPDLSPIPLAPGDVLLLVNLFGLHGAATTCGSLPAGAPPPGVIVIEDHTHDPLSSWARTSAADWCFASLRKTLPLPDGGVVWSPGGRALPRPPALTLQRRLASLEMLAATTLRRERRLPGETPGPETIRELEFKAEARLQSGAVSGMPPWTREMLENLRVSRIRERHLAAHRQLDAALEAAAGRARGIRLLRPAAAFAAGGGGPEPAARREAEPADSCPYPAVLEFARPDMRRRARRALEDAGVETLLLWPLGRQAPPDGPTAEETAFSGRMLAILHLEERLAQRGRAEATRMAALLTDARSATDDL